MRVQVLLGRVGSDAPLLEDSFIVDEVDSLSFGRGKSSNRLHVPDERREVSSAHGRIFVERDELWVEDLGSTNGTVVDDTALKPHSPVRLASGSQIIIGEFCICVAMEEVQREPQPAGVLSAAALRGLESLATQFVGSSLQQERDIEQFVERIRDFLGQSLDWLARSMHGRAEFQRQFAAEVTLILQRANNPLKGQAADSLGRTLLDWSSQSDRAEVYDQLANAIQDFSKHQLGLLEGVKEAVASIAERISPASIEDLANKNSGWLTNMRARAWDMYRQIFSEFFEENSKLFHEIISPAIRQGYLNSFDSDRPGTTRSSAGKPAD